jgi:hypothetical protein
VVATAITEQSAAARKTAKRHTAYQVQFAAYHTGARAERGWRELRRAAPDLLGVLGHTVSKARNSKSAKQLHRLRTLAYADRAPAQALCEKLKRRDVECLVVSTRDHAGLKYEPSEFESVKTPPPAPRAAAGKDGERRVAGLSESDWPKKFDAF